MLFSYTEFLDKETNLNYAYFQGYNPNTGRYVQGVPIGLLGKPGPGKGPDRRIDAAGVGCATLNNRARICG